MLYLISADTIFDTIPITDESRIQDITLPNENREISYFIDSVHPETLEWKEVISVKGWAFDNQSVAKNTEIFLVLDSGKSYKTFNTYKVTRHDITMAYKNLNISLDDSGFYANIPIYHIHEGRNRIILVLRNDRGTSFIRTNDYITKINSHIFPGFISEKQQKFDLSETPRNISYYIEEINIDTSISIKGWAVINDQDNSNIEKFVLLTSDNSSLLFDTVPSRRPDVKLVYEKNLTKNLDNSGFYGNLPNNSIEDGIYQIGLVIKKDNKTSVIISNQFIQKKNYQISKTNQQNGPFLSSI